MSVIVVVKKNKQIAIAADSNYSVGSLNIKSDYLKDRSKIIQHGDTFFGLVGATAHEHVMADLLKRYKSKLSFNSEQEIFRSYMTMHSILTQEYHLRTDDDESVQEYDSSQIDGLIANPKGIFGMYTWREVYEYEKFWAIGSGRNFALGSLFATYDELSDASMIAEKAVLAACEFDDGCELPIKTHTIAAKK